MMRNLGIALRYRHILLSISCLFTILLNTFSYGQTSSMDSLPAWRRPGSCGANCLLALLAHQKQPRDYKDIIKNLPIDKSKGVSIGEIQECARKLGVDLEVRKLTDKELDSLKPPYIMHLEAPDEGTTGHYVTVFGKDKESCYFIDGTTGLERASAWNSLISNASGYVLASPGVFKAGGIKLATVLWVGTAITILASVGFIARELIRPTRAIQSA